MASFPTAGDDSILGIGANEIIDALGGNDFVDGDGGSDGLLGGDGNDTLIAGDGNDTLFGGNGDDRLVAGAGLDSLSGDSGDDTLIGGSGHSVGYWVSGIGGVTIDVGAGIAADGLGGTDIFIGLSAFLTSNNVDRLSVGNATAASIIFVPYAGNDTITGFADDPTGRVQVDLSTTQHAALVDFVQGRATLGADLKILTNIHNVVGTVFNDTVIGSERNDFYATAGGADSIDLGDGDDQVLVSEIGCAIDLGTGFNAADFHPVGLGLRFTGATPHPPAAAPIGASASDASLAEGSSAAWTVTTLADAPFVNGSFKASRIVGTDFSDTVAAQDVDSGAPLQRLLRDDLRSVGNGLPYGVEVILEGRAGDDSGAGNFIADYQQSPAGILVSGGIGNSYTVNDGWGFQDRWSFTLGLRDSPRNDIVNLGNQLGTLILTGGNDSVTAGSGTLVIVDSPLSAIALDLMPGHIDYVDLGQRATIGGAQSVASLGILGGSLRGNGSPNLLAGGDGDESLFGRDGNDTLIGGGGDDQVDGGNGTDTWVSAAPMADYTIFVRDLAGRPYGEEAAEGVLAFTSQASADDRGIDAVRGVERFGFEGGDSLATLDDLTRHIPDGTPVTRFDPVQGLTIGGVPALLGAHGNGNAVIAPGPGTGLVDLDGGALDDLLIGLGQPGSEQANLAPPGAAEAIGPAAIDTIGDGDDRLRGGAGNDTLVGRAGDDELEGEDGNDTLEGGSGKDSAGGGPGDDIVLGGSGDDFLIGDGGNDVLIGDDGADILYGGDGDDTLRIDGDDLVVIGGDGRDVLALTAATIGLTSIDLSSLGDQNGSGIGPRIRSVEDIDASAAPAAVSITGAGDSGSHLFGSGFGDTLSGGAGDDVIAGQNGNDRIVVGAGNDSVYGGGGADDIVHTGDTGTARIFAFAPGEDHLLLEARAGYATAAAAAAALVEGAEGAVLALALGGSVVFVGLAPGALAASDFGIV